MKAVLAAEADELCVELPEVEECVVVAEPLAEVEPVKVTTDELSELLAVAVAVAALRCL